ncbi:MAG: sulfotransferase [Flavobacteriales bacterium]|nr:sulfotransferase [Flavobacteriales bacterium]
MMNHKTLNEPIIIIGNPRSGTSLLRIMLNSHPNIVIPPECGFIQWWHEQYKGWNASFTSANVELYVNDVLGSKKIETYELDKENLIEHINQIRPKSYSELSACIPISYASSKPIKRWGDKNNYYIHHIPLIKDIYPNARFIHITRDGRDVASSYLELSNSFSKGTKYLPNFPSGIEAISTAWTKNIATIESGLSKTNLITVRYEDIVLDTITVLKQILDFVECKWSEQVCNYIDYNDEPKVTAAWKEKTFSPIDPSGIGRFGTDLTGDQLDQFMAIAKPTLQRLGYA